MSIINPEKPNYTIEDIYRMTDNGLDIFKREILDFTLDKNIKNPFVKDNNPSARIKQSSKSGLWLLYIYNEDGGYYNAISFLQRKYGLNIQGVIDYVTNNLDLKPIEYTNFTTKKKREIYYSVNKIPFTQRHKDYFCIQEITETFLNEEMDIFAIDYYYINGRKVTIPDSQYMFCYEFRDINREIVKGKYKILTLGEVSKRNKWKNNLLPNEFFYSYKIKDGDTVFVTKSNKDCVPTQLLGITSIAAMSENKNNIITGLQLLIEKFPNTNFVSVQGCDPQGTNTSIAITRELEILWFNIPSKFLNMGINDNWEYIKKFGIKSFENLLKLKKFL